MLNHHFYKSTDIHAHVRHLFHMKSGYFSYRRWFHQCRWKNYFIFKNNTPQTLSEPTKNSEHSKTYQNITAKDSTRLSASALSKTSQRTGQPADKSSFLNNGRAMFGINEHQQEDRILLAEVVRTRLCGWSNILFQHISDDENDLNETVL